MFIAEHLAKRGHSVTIVEKTSDYLGRASYTNQARVHNGYHYPRSVLTAVRSRIAFPRFIQEFSECVDDQAENYYMIGKLLGNVTAKQFEKFCQCIGAPLEPAPRMVTNLVNPHLIEAAYRATECTFSAVKLRRHMAGRLKEAGVNSMHQAEVKRVHSGRAGRFSIEVLHRSEETITIDQVDHVFNCTYSMINAVNIASGFEVIPLKHEMAEICLVEMPAELRECGVTVMCGPFFSFLPFPSMGCHSFTHVRYTPHHEWFDNDGQHYISPDDRFHRKSKRSAWPSMQRDAMRYIPALEGARYIDSLWEVKTVLPRSDSDDSRPILFLPNHGADGFHCVLGGKIDNAYDAVNEIDRLNLVK